MLSKVSFCCHNIQKFTRVDTSDGWSIHNKLPSIESVDQYI